MTRKKGQDAGTDAEDDVGTAGKAARGGASESGNRPGADEENQGKTELQREAERDSAAGLQEAGRSSAGVTEGDGTGEDDGRAKRAGKAQGSDRRATLDRLWAIPEADLTSAERDELMRTQDAEVQDLLTANADDDEAKLKALGISDTPPMASTGFVAVDNRDSSGNLRPTWYWRGHRYRGEVVEDQEKGPNGERRYFLQRNRANVGAPMLDRCTGDRQPARVDGRHSGSRRSEPGLVGRLLQFIHVPKDQFLDVLVPVDRSDGLRRLRRLVAGDGQPGHLRGALQIIVRWHQDFLARLVFAVRLARFSRFGPADCRPRWEADASACASARLARSARPSGWLSQGRWHQRIEPQTGQIGDLVEASFADDFAASAMASLPQFVGFAFFSIRSRMSATSLSK